MLVLLVTAYGAGAAGAGLLQVRQLLEGRRSCEVSALFFAVYAGGYAIWLAYGVSIDSLPLVIVDGIGVVCATSTLAIALSLRGSLLNPGTWRNCPRSRTALRRRAGPQPASSPTRAPHLRQPLQPREAAPSDRAQGTGAPRTGRRSARRRQDPAPRPARRPHPRVLPSRRMSRDTDIGALQYGAISSARAPPYSASSVRDEVRAERR
jgi:hypothetical protein